MNCAIRVSLDCYTWKRELTSGTTAGAHSFLQANAYSPCSSSQYASVLV